MKLGRITFALALSAVLVGPVQAADPLASPQTATQLLRGAAPADQSAQPSEQLQASNGVVPAVLAAELGVTPEILALVGDVEYGGFLAQECFVCHQTSGSDNGIPSITGWPVENFVVALHAYRQGFREDQVMQMVAQRLDDEQIAALAAYFAGLTE